VADTYSNTTDKSHGMKQPDYDQQKLKYPQNFQQDMHALSKTAYCKKQYAIEKKDDAIVARQKKHY